MKILFLGLPGVPYARRACDIRLLSFAQAFIEKGNKVIIFNKYPIKLKNIPDVELLSNNSLKIIEVINAHGHFNKFFLLITKVFAYPSELIKIIKLNNSEKIDVIQIYTGHFIDLMFYCFISKLIRAKTVYQYVEFRSEIARNGFYHKVNGYLCDYYSQMFVDGVICISNYLESHLKKIAPTLPIIKIPPICDFDLFETITIAKSNSNYMLFCGSAGYLDVIKFVIESYWLSKCSEYNTQLILILNGSKKEIDEVKLYIGKKQRIEIISNLGYGQLIEYYKNAKALLIPLRDTKQDIARFPNKICEYTASKSVIITTNNGEIPYYFEDKINAIIASKYSVDLFSEKINWVLEHENSIGEIRENSFNVGKKYFDMKAYINVLEKFLYRL